MSGAVEKCYSCLICYPLLQNIFKCMFEVIIMMSQHSNVVIQHITLFMCAFMKVVLVPNFHHLNLIFTGNAENKSHGTKVWKNCVPTPEKHIVQSDHCESILLSNKK